MDGWMGTILRVNLDKLKYIKVPLDKLIAKDYIGGCLLYTSPSPRDS